MATKQDKQHAIDMLRRILEPGDTVVIVKRKQLRDLDRVLDFYTFKPGSSKRLVSSWLSGQIATLFDLGRDKDSEGVILDEDGRELVAYLSEVLFGSVDALDTELI